MDAGIVDAIRTALTRRPLPPGPITLLKVLREAGAEGMRREDVADAMRWGDPKGLGGVLGAFSKRLSGTPGLDDQGKDAVIEISRSSDGDEILRLTEEGRTAIESLPGLLEWLELDCDAIHERAENEGLPSFEAGRRAEPPAPAAGAVAPVKRRQLAALFRVFRNNPRFQVVVRVRETRAAQIRDLFRRTEPLGLDEFNREIWRIESQTLIRGKLWPEPLADRCGTVESAHLIEDALDRGEVELHGNYIWREGTKRYGVNISLSDEELERNIALMREILLDADATPLEKAARLRDIPGVGKGVSSGLASLFHPDAVIQLNNRSCDFMALLGLSRNLSLQDYCAEMRRLADDLGAHDFLELDYFLYASSAGEIVLPERPPARFWWVNQGRSFGLERNRGILRAGRAGDDGPFHHENVGELAPGDLVFHHVSGDIVAVSTPKAPGVDLDDDDESEEGRRWFCLMSYVDLPRPVSLAPLLHELAQRRTSRGPIDRNGKANQGYLFELDEDAARRLAIAAIKNGADPALFEALEPLEGGEKVAEAPTMTKSAKNIILYGPPGTGKTYRTTEMAVSLCLQEDIATLSRAEIRARYRQLRDERRIEFVTFHQSYSYEEFVEGIRPTLRAKGEDGEVGYECRPGVFRAICDRANQARRVRRTPEAAFELAGRTVWKMSIGNWNVAGDQVAYEAAIENGRVYLGYGQGLDFSGADTLDAVRERLLPDHPDDAEGYSAKAVHLLKNEMTVGDVVVVAAGLNHFRAIGVVTGPYEHVAPPVGNFAQTRPVRWLRVLDEPTSREQIARKQFTVATLHKLKPNTILAESLEDFINAGEDDQVEAFVPYDAAAKQYVLVIDEINRGNISRILGELITLLEPDKRLGQENELTVTLPYSGDEFGVPPNLHVIGTMNTADRSIAFLDSALRRRFRFEEILPDAAVIRRHVGVGGVIDGVDLARILEVMNRRIEVLLDRDHQLGHSYFMKIGNLEDLREAFSAQIVPLLQEYFYDEWPKTCAVLGCPPGTPADRAIVLSEELDDLNLAEGMGFGEERRRHVLNPAFVAATGATSRTYFLGILEGGVAEASE